MKRILTAVAFFMAILTVGSSVWAYSYKDHVSVAPNGQGDVLIFPVFVSTTGWENRVTIVNTSAFSVVAKVVVRSAVFSQEVLDFLIYLSPYDMWYGFIQYTDKGPQMYSTDSSALYDSGIHYYDIPEPFATESNPMKFLFAPVNCKQDTNLLGYIEVIEAWSGNVVFTTEEYADKQKRGKKIALSYDNAGTPYAAGTTRNVLAGTLDIDVEAQGLSMSTSIEAVALKDYDNVDYMTAKVTSWLGDQSNNNVREVEAALAKNSIVMPFINNTEGTTLHTFTFPTKQSQTTTACVYGGTRISDYFPLGQSVPYLPTVFDNDERRADNPFSPPKNYSLPNEFSFTDVTTVVFKQGWINYVLPDPRVYNGVNKQNWVLRYTGSPVIPLVLDFRAGFTFKSPSYADGVVSGTVDGSTTGTPLLLPGYHYTSSYAPS